MKSVVKLTQEMIQSDVLTLEHSLKDVIKCVNARRKEDTASTNAVLGHMNDRINKHVDSQVLA